MLLACHFLLYWIFLCSSFPVPFSLSFSFSLSSSHSIYWACRSSVCYSSALLRTMDAKESCLFSDIITLLCQICDSTCHSTLFATISDCTDVKMDDKVETVCICMCSVYIVQSVHSTYWHNFITNLIQCDWRVYDGVRIRKTNIYDECFFFVLMLLINIHTSILLWMTFHLSSAGCMCEL